MTRLTRTLAPAAVIATIAGAAHAQFVREGSAAATPAAGARMVQSITQIEDGLRFELRIENGEIVHARVDGEDCPKDRVVREGGSVVLRNPDGGEVHRFELGHLPGSPARDAAPRPGRAWAPSAPAAPAAPGAPAASAEIAVAFETPKVMVGVRFSEPGDALRTHLGLDADTSAIIVDEVVKGLPADRAGLRTHDVIVSINGSDGASGELLQRELQSASPGDPIELTVLRGAERLTLKAELDAYDAEALGSQAMRVRVAPSVPGTPQTPAHEHDLARTAREHARMMQDLAERLSRDASRQMLELRNGRLFVRSAEELDEQMKALREEFGAGAARVRPEMEERLRRMEERMEAFERGFEERMDRLQDLMDRMDQRLDRGDRRD